MLAQQILKATNFARSLLQSEDAAAARDSLSVSTAQETLNLVYPVGITQPWDWETLPSFAGQTWLKINGAGPLNKVTYSTLWNSPFSIHLTDIDANSFRLPDWRGYSFRVASEGRGAAGDPDAASRTARGDGQAGDRIGTFQQGAFGSHNHINNIELASNLPGSYGFTAGGAYAARALVNTGNQNTNNPTGGTETRSKNVARFAVVRAA